MMRFPAQTFWVFYQEMPMSFANFNRSAQRVALVALLAGTLGACSAAKVALNNSELQVKTHMSESIFLDPVPEAYKTVYVSARNTSDHPEIDLRGPLMQAIQARGYRVVSDPNQAHFMLRSNILQAGKIDPTSKDQMLASGYGEPLLGGAAAAVTAGALGGDAAAMTGVGLGVGVATFLANELIKDVTYALTVDIQLSERPSKGKKVQQVTTTNNQGGNSSADALATSGGMASATTNNSRSKSQYVAETKDFKQYNVRTIAYADQMNLKFEEAVVPLTAKLTSSISNLLD
jgi:hypothetical protein